MNCVEYKKVSGFSEMRARTRNRWTTERTAALGGVLQSALHGYTEGAITVTTGLVTLISRFVLQVCRSC